MNGKEEKGGVFSMEEKSKLEEMKKRLPVNDPGYIAFKKLKGILGEINAGTMREERTDEVIARYKCCS